MKINYTTASTSTFKPLYVAKISYGSNEKDLSVNLMNKLIQKNFVIVDLNDCLVGYIENYNEYLELAINVCKIARADKENNQLGSPIFTPIRRNTSKFILEKNLQDLIDFIKNNSTNKKVNDYIFNNFILNGHYDVDYNKSSIKIWLSSRNSNTLNFIYKYDSDISKDYCKLDIELSPSLRRNIYPHELNLYTNGKVGNNHILNYKDIITAPHEINEYDLTYSFENDTSLSLKDLYNCSIQLFENKKFLNKLTNKCIELAKQRSHDAYTNLKLERLGCAIEHSVSEWECNHAEQYKYIIYKELPNNIRFKYLKHFQSQLDNILDWNKEIEFSSDTYNKKM